jgi:hypothetical protein
LKKLTKAIQVSPFLTLPALQTRVADVGGVEEEEEEVFMYV